MSQHVYDQPAVFKKGHFEQDKKDGGVDIYVSAESLRVYDNPWLDNISPNMPGPAEAQQSARAFIRENSGKKNYVFVMFCGALCLLLLAGIICIGVQMKIDQTYWDKERNQLLAVKDDLRKTTLQLTVKNAQLQRERDDLWDKFCRPKPRKCRKLGLTPTAEGDQE